MSISINIQNIVKASFQTLTHTNTFDFDVVRVSTTTARADLFFPAGTGQAVADAINAAVKPTIAEAAE